MLYFRKAVDKVLLLKKYGSILSDSSTLVIIVEQTRVFLFLW